MVPSNRVVLSPENKPQHALNAKVGVGFKTICLGRFEKNRLPLEHLIKTIRGVPSEVTCAAIIGQKTLTVRTILF